MQLVTSKTISFFDEMFRNKFLFERYTDKYKPALFFGLYHSRDIQGVIDHKGPRIVWLAGSDAMVDNTIKTISEHEGFKDAIIVAESSWIEKDLDKFNIKYEKISFCLDDIYKWKPTPLGDSIFWYNANTSKYGKKYLSEVRRAFPEINIITNDHKAIPHEKMGEIYSKCFINIRPVLHDGQSQSVAEAALMGRYSIYNGNGPFSLKYNNVEDIIRIIGELKNGYNYRLVAKRSLLFFIDNEVKFSDLVLSRCGRGEADFLKIFYEDPKRPASIFRLMRKEVVERLTSNFGTDQFERPYMVEQMKKEGLKSIICSKNSGYHAREYKNDGNKGYDEFNDYLTKQ